MEHPTEGWTTFGRRQIRSRILKRGGTEQQSNGSVTDIFERDSKGNLWL